MRLLLSNRTFEENSARGTVSQRSFPEAHAGTRNGRHAEFRVEIGEYRGVVRIRCGSSSTFSRKQPTPKGGVAAYYLQRPRFESIAERKLRRRQ